MLAGMSSLPSLRRALLGLGLLTTTACTSVVAAPMEAHNPYQPHPAIAIVQRLGEMHAVPDLTGVEVSDAGRRLRDLGLDVQVVAFDDGSAVSAQYPQAGATLPADRFAVLWVGAPPAPPPPPPPSPAPDAPVAEAPVAEAALPAPTPEAASDAPVPSEAPQPSPGDSPSPPTPPGGTTASTSWVPTPDPASGPASSPGPPAPRTSPRNLPPSEPGTVLEGLASWYGPGFAGRTTACGGVFDPSQLTLATRELRCGTLVKVTGPSGASVEAVAKDWGPAEWTGRRFDLSQATFAAVHHPGAGVVRVTVEVLG
jgi:hypothetical protein